MHDLIGVPKCEVSAERTSRCKLAFRDKFSEDLVKKHMNEVGDKNKFGENY